MRPLNEITVIRVIEGIIVEVFFCLGIIAISFLLAYFVKLF